MKTRKKNSSSFETETATSASCMVACMYCGFRREIPNVALVAAISVDGAETESRARFRGPPERNFLDHPGLASTRQHEAYLRIEARGVPKKEETNSGAKPFATQLRVIAWLHFFSFFLLMRGGYKDAFAGSAMSTTTTECGRLRS